MRIFRKVILFCFFITPAVIKSQSLNSKVQDEVYNTIILIGNAWTQNNLDSLEKYIDKDYVHTDVHGQILNKISWLNYLKDRKEKNVNNPSLEFEEIKIAIHQDIALVTGINSFSGQAFTTNDKNTNKARKLRFTQVLKKEKDAWKRIMFQATYIE
jgi:ketosteroid isomerase-like protein